MCFDTTGDFVQIRKETTSISWKLFMKVVSLPESKSWSSCKFISNTTQISCESNLFVFSDTTAVQKLAVLELGSAKVQYIMNLYIYGYCLHAAKYMPQCNWQMEFLSYFSISYVHLPAGYLRGT